MVFRKAEHLSYDARDSPIYLSTIADNNFQEGGIDVYASACARRVFQSLAARIIKHLWAVLFRHEESSGLVRGNRYFAQFTNLFVQAPNLGDITFSSSLFI